MLDVELVLRFCSWCSALAFVDYKESQRILIVRWNMGRFYNAKEPATLGQNSKMRSALFILHSVMTGLSGVKQADSDQMNLWGAGRNGPNKALYDVVMYGFSRFHSRSGGLTEWNGMEWKRKEWKDGNGWNGWNGMEWNGWTPTILSKLDAAGCGFPQSRHHRAILNETDPTSRTSVELPAAPSLVVWFALIWLALTLKRLRDSSGDTVIYSPHTDVQGRSIEVARDVHAVTCRAAGFAWSGLLAIFGSVA